MHQTLRPLIAANWKMHGDFSWTSKPTDFEAIYPASERDHLDVLICPPATLLASMSGGVFLGGQDCHAEVSGAHTGDVSAEMLKDAGATYVIVGHSECRAGGDTDEDVHAKATAAIRAGLIPIICVGETEEQRDAGQAEVIVSDQIKASVPDIENYVIAYEPVWAIGTGKTATPADVDEIHNGIRAQVGPNIQLLYGGSVKPANATELLALENVNGALIGGAGLEMESLAAIARAAPAS